MEKVKRVLQAMARHRRCFLCFLLVAILLFGLLLWAFPGGKSHAPSGAAAQPQADAATALAAGSPADFRVVAYFPSWKNDTDKLRFDILTHVLYAFAIPTAEGGLHPLENEALAREVVGLAHAGGAKALLAVGGWSYQDEPLEETFNQATATEEKLRAFGDAIVAMCDEYGFDGVDMDWEYPRADEASGRQYEQLMLYLSEKLHRQGKLLTAAVMAGVQLFGIIKKDAAAQTDAVLGAVDWIHIMAYNGGNGARHAPYQFAVDCAAYWKEERGLPTHKVVLGMPFYARPGGLAYGTLIEAQPDASERDWAQFNGSMVFYNGQQTVRKKTRYALEHLGGVMIWEITHDTRDPEKSLLTAIGQELA